jgi:hypothetical protein
MDFSNPENYYCKLVMVCSKANLCNKWCSYLFQRELPSVISSCLHQCCPTLSPFATSGDRSINKNGFYRGRSYLLAYFLVNIWLMWRQPSLCCHKCDDKKNLVGLYWFTYFESLLMSLLKTDHFIWGNNFDGESYLRPIQITILKKLCNNWIDKILEERFANFLFSFLSKKLFPIKFKNTNPHSCFGAWIQKLFLMFRLFCTVL